MKKGGKGVVKLENVVLFPFPQRYSFEINSYLYSEKIETRFEKLYNIYYAHIKNIYFSRV